MKKLYPAFLGIQYPVGYPVSFAGYPANETILYHGISKFFVRPLCNVDNEELKTDRNAQ